MKAVSDIVGEGIGGNASAFSAGGGGNVSVTGVAMAIPWALGGGVHDHAETFALAGVTSASLVIVALACGADVDDLDTEELGPVTLAAVPGTDEVTVHVSFSGPTSGLLKLNLMVA